MPRLPIDEGIELEVRLEGPPPPGRAGWSVLYLHGFGSRQSGEKASFFRQRFAAEEIPFASFDFRGHGASGGELGAFTFGRNLDDLARVRAWLSEQGHRRLVLVGSSLGGATALASAARDPEGIEACLLIAPAVGLGAALERWAGPDGLAAWEREGKRRYQSELVEADLGWEIVADLRRLDFLEIARDLRVPTLAIQGGRDTSVDPHDVLAFVAAAPSETIDLVLWGDGDHRMIERKPAIWREMGAFLERRGLLAPARPAATRPV